jgi:hypothetical protein
MIRVKEFNATGVAPLGRLYAGDLLAIMDAAAGLSDFTQTVDVSALRVGDSAIQLLKHGTLDARITAALRADGIIRGLGGFLPGAFTNAQRDAIAVGLAPYGVSILNSEKNKWEWNAGSDVARNWQLFGLDSLAGNLGDIPLATAVPPGTKYFAVDQVVEYRSDGTVWKRLGFPAGFTGDWFKPDAAAPTGWVKYDGTSLPGSTGIYADLYAHLGNTVVTPNTKGRTTVGHDPGDADWDTVGETRGAKTVNISHTHSIPDTNNSKADGGQGFQSLADNNTGAMSGNSNPSVIQPSVVAVKIAKL